MAAPTGHRREGDRMRDHPRCSRWWPVALRRVPWAESNLPFLQVTVDVITPPALLSSWSLPSLGHTIAIRWGPPAEQESVHLRRDVFRSAPVGGVPISPCHLSRTPFDSCSAMGRDHCNGVAGSYSLPMTRISGVPGATIRCGSKVAGGPGRARQLRIRGRPRTAPACSSAANGRLGRVSAVLAVGAGSTAWIASIPVVLVLAVGPAG